MKQKKIIVPILTLAVMLLMVGGVYAVFSSTQPEKSKAENVRDTTDQDYEKGLTEEQKAFNELINKQIYEETANNLEQYEQYGLTYNSDENQLFFNGKSVCYFADNRATDGTFEGTEVHSANGDIGKGSRGSSSDSLQTAGRELCMPDEIRRMRDDECLLLMRSEDPVIDKKYNLLHHPNVKYTPDAGGEPYVMPPDYMGDAVTITMDAVAAATAPEITEEMYEQLDYLEKHPEENYYENEENFSQYDQGD